MYKILCPSVLSLLIVYHYFAIIKYPHLRNPPPLFVEYFDLSISSLVHILQWQVLQKL